MSFIWRARPLALSFIFFLMPLLALSVEPNEILNNPDLEDRARSISKSLRCLVCRNESIDDSNAELARDLRLLVRERLVLGDNDKEIIDYVVGRYGEYVLLKPKFSFSNIFLWLCGPIMFILGLLFVVSFYWRKTKTEEIHLSDEDENKITELLKD